MNFNKPPITNQDVNNYIEKVINDLVLEYIANEIQTEIGISLTRDETKILFLKSCLGGIHIILITQK
jgi:hypothetical protein